MLLGDLLDEPELGLSLLTGREHVDRPVRGIYITDLIDPRRYLHGGELVLSGLVWHTGPADSERFAAALADAGVAGLAAGTARLGSAPADLVEACVRHEVPLFEVPLAVSFNTLSEHVLGTERRGSVPRQELVTAVASGARLQRVLAMATSELGAECWVLSAVGSVVGGRTEPDEPDRRALVREFLASERVPRTVRSVGSGGPYVLWPIGAGTELRAARWFAVLTGDHREWTREQEAVAADLGTAVALLRSRLDESRQAASGAVEVALQGLLDGSAGPLEVAARLEAAGLPTGEPLRVVSLDAGAGSGPAATLLREIADSTGLASVTAPMDEGALALFAGRPDGSAEDGLGLDGLDEHLRRTVADIEHAMSGSDPRSARLKLGVSDTSETRGLRGAVEEARFARGLAEHRPGRCGIATADELASHQVLLASVPDELRRSYHRRLLARLIDYDETHHSDLVNTLWMFLECSGSWSRCAKQLHVHVNTLRYRIQRVEEITGRDLAVFATRVDFYLALRLDN